MRARGDLREAVEVLREVILRALRAGAEALNIGEPRGDSQSAHEVFMRIPAAFRPAVGEPELELFDFKYRMIAGGDEVDPRFVEAGLELAERILHWASSIVSSSLES